MMPQPSLDEIFGDNSTKPSLDEIFGNAPAPKSVKEQGAFNTVTDQGLSGLTFGLGNRAQAGLAAAVMSGIDDRPFLDTIGENYKKAREIKTKQMEQQMEESPALAITSNIAGGLALGGIGAGTKAGAALGNSLRGGKVLGRELGVAGRITKGAAAGAASGAAYGAGTAGYDQSLSGAGKGAILGAVAGGAIPAVGAVAGKLIEKATPVAAEGLRDVGKLAQKFNIPVSLNQISDSRMLKNLQKVSQEVPLSGQEAFRESQMKAFNKALFKTVGVDADRFTPENMAFAFKKVGNEFDNITKGKQFNIGSSFIDDITQTADEVASTYGDDAAKIYQKEALKVIDDFGSGDVISGELIGRQRARINGLARKAQDPNIKGALLDLENNIVDGITGGDSATQAALTAAKNRYKNLIVLEPIANKAKGGFISPTLLNGRVSQVYRRAHTIGQSGDIGDLARIGNELLPELGGSDTTQKMAYLASIATGISNPATALPIAGGAIANRAAQSGLNRNQALVKMALNNAEKTNLPSKIQPVLPQISAPAGAAAGTLAAPQPTQQNVYKPSAPVELNRVQMQPMSYTAPQSLKKDYFDSIKQAESGGNPNAKATTSSASGLYQFTDQTWKDSVSKWGKKYGITEKMKNNPRAQEVMVRELAADNARILTNKLNREPNVADMYVAHVFGADQGAKLINSIGTNRPAFMIMPPRVVNANKSIFFDGKKPRTVEQVYTLLGSKVS